MKIIKAIEIKLPMITERYEVGKYVDSYWDKREITEIRENSIETEGGFTHIIEVFVSDGICKEFVSTPMSIDYYKKEAKK